MNKNIFLIIIKILNIKKGLKTIPFKRISLKSTKLNNLKSNSKMIRMSKIMKKLDKQQQKYQINQNNQAP